VYYFSVFNDGLEKTMDVFSRFFIDPLFDEDCVNREINAVNSEHNKNLNSQMWHEF
jgi:insulysin